MGPRVTQHMHVERYNQPDTANGSTSPGLAWVGYLNLAGCVGLIETRWVWVDHTNQVGVGEKHTPGGRGWKTQTRWGWVENTNQVGMGGKSKPGGDEWETQTRWLWGGEHKPGGYG
eukprot:jgi/Chrzof1/5462/Cz16g04080.t1